MSGWGRPCCRRKTPVNARVNRCRCRSWRLYLAFGLRHCQTACALERRISRTSFMASLPASVLPTEIASRAITATQIPITVLIAVPTLDGGAADAGAIELVRILSEAGHRAIVASRAGRLVADIATAGGEFVPLDV